MALLEAYSLRAAFQTVYQLQTLPTGGIGLIFIVMYAFVLFNLIHMFHPKSEAV